MAPQFRHARDPDGQMLFVAVWRCSECGRITF
jgi:ABC-type ATPase with predicted acetyltransferase domain